MSAILLNAALLTVCSSPSLLDPYLSVTSPKTLDIKLWLPLVYWIPDENKDASDPAFFVDLEAPTGILETYSDSESEDWGFFVDLEESADVYDAAVYEAADVSASAPVDYFRTSPASFSMGIILQGVFDWWQSIANASTKERIRVF